jgi:hypothetical protein
MSYNIFYVFFLDFDFVYGLTLFFEKYIKTPLNKILNKCILSHVVGIFVNKCQRLEHNVFFINFVIGVISLLHKTTINTFFYTTITTNQDR